jgi:predicted  nucleic acid-binding Zn-ribbon protein
MKLSSLVLLGAVVHGQDNSDSESMSDTWRDMLNALSDFKDNWKDTMGDFFKEKFADYDKETAVERTKEWYKKLGEEMKEEWESKGGDAMVQDLKDSMNAAWSSMKGWTIGDMLDAMDEAKVSLKDKMAALKDKITATNLEEIIEKLEDKSEDVEEVVTGK